MAEFLCTPETPWNESLPTPVRHSNTHEIGDQEDGWPGGDYVTMECANCGTRWRQELPQ